MNIFGENNIVFKKGKNPGKTISVFAGIHGNEQVGVLALNKIIDEVEVTHGCVYFVIANPEAVKQNVREVNVNMNRLFSKDEQGNTPEHNRVEELMQILDESDALLDLHASNSKKTEPFIICRDEDLGLASKLSVGIVSYGWDKLVPGSTDAYMSRQNKPALCVECGSVFEVKKNLPLTINYIKQFLTYFGAIDEVVSMNTDSQKIIKIDKIVTKQTDNFSFVKEFNDFDSLLEGEVFAVDGSIHHIAESNQCIIFPRPNKPVGGDVFILGKIF